VGGILRVILQVYIHDHVMQASARRRRSRSTLDSWWSLWRKLTRREKKDNDTLNDHGLLSSQVAHACQVRSGGWSVRPVRLATGNMLYSGPVVGWSSRSGCLQVIGQQPTGYKQSGDWSVRSVRLPTGNKLYSGPAVGRSGRSGCLGAVRFRLYSI
jgi:hypothetical protein